MKPILLLQAGLAGLALCAALPLAAAPVYPYTDFGVAFSKDEPWYQQCMRVAPAAAPPALPESAGSQPDDGCDASALYYRKRNQAATSSAEWEQVRQCALRQGDTAVLMMLYANGLGVKRNLDTAIHYACQPAFAAKAEIEGRVAHLAKGVPEGVLFDQCDDITSGAMGAVCADIAATQAQAIRRARLDSLARQLPPAGAASLQRLRLAFQAYVEAVEYDMQGTAAAGMALGHQSKLEEQFTRAVLDAHGARLARATPDAVRRLDGQLNRLYRRVTGAASGRDPRTRIGNSTIERADVVKAQRLWLAYRDAFLAFHSKAPAGSDAHAITALLLRQRIEELHKIARYLSA